MKTSIKLRIGFCILLSVLLLVMIGRKSRENFEGSNVLPSSANVYNQSGYPIDETSNPNHIEEPREQGEQSEQNKLCALSSRTDAEREKDISKDVAEARQQLREHLKHQIDAQKAKEERAKSSPFYDPKGADCSLLRFPAII
tara:strand:+ start:112 stop:537 length:426 start_codon:yes stop_codon:yes gene_type:complete